MSLAKEGVAAAVVGLLLLAFPAAHAAPLPPYNLSGVVKFNLGSPLRLSDFGPISLVDAGFGGLSFTASGTPSPSLVASAQIGPGTDPNISGAGSGFLEYAFEILGPSGLVPVRIDVAGAVSGFATSGASFVVESRWDLLDAGVPLAGDDISSGQLTGSFNRNFGHTVDVALAANHVYSIFMLSDAFAAAGIAGSHAIADALIDPVFSFGSGVDPEIYSFSFSAGIGNSRPASVPEPGTLALLAASLFLLGLVRTCAGSAARRRCHEVMEGNMPASIAHALKHSIRAAALGAWIAVGAAGPARANVITDWDEKAIAVVAPLASAPSPRTPYAAYRMMGLVHTAMFDAVNSIDRRYRPYLVQLPANPATSKEAAAAAAAAAILATIDAKTAGEVKGALANYLASIADGAAKLEGVKLGEAVAAKILAERANDGSDAADDYRPRTTPGVYVPTPIMRGPMWPGVRPFALASPSQFRPGPPIALDSKEWATDFNEVKEFGAQKSAKRTAQQTETARFWLVGGPVAYHPFARQLAIAKNMDVVESARFMALEAIAINDALIAVLDAKYHYNFWRPLTAIRNGDIDDNPATEREATWQPLADTPMHPEYPCAHCIVSGSVAGVAKAVLGTDDIPEISVASPTAPGVTHRWTNLTDFTQEVASARIWAGFHYRFSTRVGTAMGQKIGEHVVKTVMQPVVTGSR